MRADLQRWADDLLKIEEDIRRWEEDISLREVDSEITAADLGTREDTLAYQVDALTHREGELSRRESSFGRNDYTSIDFDYIDQRGFSRDNFVPIDYDFVDQRGFGHDDYASVNTDYVDQRGFGLRFIGNNSSCITNEKCDTPIGFNIIFPGMIRSGIHLGLDVPLRQSDVDTLFQLREKELQVATANALKYLDILGNKFGSSVPVVYPSNIYSLLCMVDTLEKMGISHHFSCEINSVLDMTYRSWLQNEEEPIMDMETCAMAFRILSMHGYDISSDVFSQFAEESRFHDSVPGHLNDTKTFLELYKASQVCILEHEWTLENIGSWTSKLLKQQLCSRRVSRSVIPQEVEYALNFPFYSAAVEPLEHKRNIEHFDTKGIQMQKSAYLACHSNEYILALAIEEFYWSQSLYQQELKRIESYVKEVGLERLKFARTTPLNVWVFIASTVFPSELSDARIAWIQNCLVAIAVDDFFDGGGSAEELQNLIWLIEKWDAHAEIGFCSEHVEILFYAVYHTSYHIGAKAAKVQNRRVMGHIAELWLDLVRAYMAEAEWTWRRYLPTMEEYMSVAEVSNSMDPVVGASLYLVGPELSEGMVSGPEYKVRLLNDLHTYEKERGEGYVNSALLHAHRCCGGGGGGSES
ncbi:stemar-13-ene synthase-like [Phragmites australis]|uniref:stemar-13-ene synthase-like n=1 Tax=Phragmites australis TaxID=29695 RepID=UPI002D79A83E|nr:stemar-13-ene synthase-like [Phragmites australis]